MHQNVVELEPPLWSINDLAGFCGLSRDTIYRRIREGKLPAVRFGTAIRIREENVLKFLETVSPYQASPGEGHDRPQAPKNVRQL